MSEQKEIAELKKRIEQLEDRLSGVENLLNRAEVHNNVRIGGSSGYYETSQKT